LREVSRHVPCSADGVVVCCVSEAMRLAAIAIPAIVAMKHFMSILIYSQDAGRKGSPMVTGAGAVGAPPVRALISSCG